MPEGEQAKKYALKEHSLCRLFDLPSSKGSYVAATFLRTHLEFCRALHRHLASDRRLFGQVRFSSEVLSPAAAIDVQQLASCSSLAICVSPRPLQIAVPGDSTHLVTRSAVAAIKLQAAGQLQHKAFVFMSATPEPHSRH